MELLKYTTFKNLLNNAFKVKIEKPISGVKQEGVNASLTEVEFRLVEAVERDSDQIERFSLIFHGPANQLLPQKLYTLTHDTLGEQQIFLVPVGEMTEGEGEGRKVVGYKYQAVFNRFKTSNKGEIHG